MADSTAGAPPPDVTTFQAIRRGLCPLCRSGRIFAGRWKMNDTCPACHTPFEREPGYFVGAMYISYAMAVPILATFTAILSYGIFPSWPLHLILIPAVLAFLPLVPAVFRYSRILWIHLDRRLDPG
jgi:uncharacterized protein (DUF983 family)